MVFPFRRDEPTTVEELRRAGRVNKRPYQRGDSTAGLIGLTEPFTRFWASVAGPGLQTRPRPPQVRQTPSFQRGANANPGFAQQLLSALNPMAGIAGIAQSIMGQQQQQPDVWSELLGLQDPSRYMPDPAELQRQAQAAAYAQYNPLIAALKEQISGTQSRGARYDRDLGQLYGQLSSSLKGDIPEIEEQYDVTERETGAEFKELESDIKGQYAQTQKEQEDTLKRLNIEAAAAETLPEQMADRDYFVNRARQDASTSRQALGQEERADIAYTRGGSQIARMTGAERRADLGSQLQEIIGGLEGQVGAHHAARSQAITAGLGDLQGQAMQAAQQQAQQEFQNRMAMLQYERQLRNDEFDQLQQGQEAAADPLKTLQQIPQAALQMNPAFGQREAGNITQVFRNVLDDPNFGWDPSGQVSLNKYQLAQRALEEGRRMNLGPQQLAALQALALEYFGAR